MSDVRPRLRAFGVTDIGLVRRANEDAFAMAELASTQRWRGSAPADWSTEGGVLLLVSDGMGGAKAGEVASAMSVDSVLAGMVSVAKHKKLDGDALRRAVEVASAAVHDSSKRPDRRGMGATLTAVLVLGRSAFVAQVGDSRAYLLRDGVIGQITHDQSYVQMLVDAGIMTPEEAEVSPRKNIILQVMGQETVRVALGRLDLESGDRLLICSDGLTNVVDDSTVNAVVKPPGSVVRAARALVSLAKEGGAPDNVTVIVAELVSE
jgi:serine/threonine protein phosphatase PrpC